MIPRSSLRLLAALLVAILAALPVAGTPRIATSAGTTTDSVVSAAGDRLGAKAGTTLNWFLPDLHGSIAASLDATEATVTNAIRYDAYGQTIATGSAGGTAAGERAWKYQGRLDIAPEGLLTPLYDMSARFYAPGIGAFTQLDTVMGSAQDPLSMNRFLYAQANPATLTDPTGHFAFLALLVPVAIGFFAGAGIDAGVQQVTTGTVDWNQAAVSGVIGSVSGGTGGIAAAGAKSVVTAGVKAVAGTAARPVVTRVAAATTGAVVQTAVDQAIQTAALPPDQRDTGWQSGAVSVTTQLGTEAAFEAGKHLPGRWGAAFRAFDAGLGAGSRRDSTGTSEAGPAGSATSPVRAGEAPSGTTATMRAAPASGLLPGEGRAGTYDELIRAGSKGDNLTPNHMPQAAYMQASVPGYRRPDGIAMNMEQPPTAGRHRETVTYGRSPVLTRTPREQLNIEVRDARRIYMRHGLYGPQVRQGLLTVIRENRARWPSYFGRRL